MGSPTESHLVDILTEFSGDDITWPEGRKLYEWWHTARKDRKFPARRDFRPASMIKILPTIQLIDVGENTRQYSVRLIGTRITEILGFDPTGKRLDEIPGTERVRAAYDWVIDNEKPIMRLNQPTKWANNKMRTCSVLILPLGPEGEQVRMLLLNFHFH